ncbi:hypothetical protein AB0J90_28745 [Micromonospora sp. NPDC049523]|uniref:hypothetical protein n=1 Tax=Micromonospora sp. NPDC049523 TaxID=3155921 RepID=UPI003436FE0A
MPEPDYHGLRDEAGRAARQPEFSAVRRRADRIRARHHAVTAVGGALSVALVLGVTGYVIGPSADRAPTTAATTRVTGPLGTPVTPRASAPTSGEPYVWWSGAADPEHLYALVADCYFGCEGRLLASTDAGRTWWLRYTIADTSLPITAALSPITVIDATTLIANSPSPLEASPEAADGQRGQLPVPQQRRQISTDGGVTWADLATTETLVAEAPSDSSVIAASPGWTGQYRLCAIDPVRKQLAPLASQPPLRNFQLAGTPPGIGLWVSGYDMASNRPALAVSRDRGRTWQTHVFAAEPAPPNEGTPPTMYLPNLATADGRTAYVLFSVLGQPARVYRSTDGAANWQRSSPEGPLSQRPLLAERSFVAADGTHVLLAQRGATPEYGSFDFLGSADGTAYTPRKMTGLVKLPTLDPLPQTIDQSHYLYRDDHQLYLSDDGWRWRAVPVP